MHIVLVQSDTRVGGIPMFDTVEVYTGQELRYGEKAICPFWRVDIAELFDFSGEGESG